MAISNYWGGIVPLNAYGGYSPGFQCTKYPGQGISHTHSISYTHTQHMPLPLDVVYCGIPWITAAQVPRMQIRSGVSCEAWPQDRRSVRSQCISFADEWKPSGVNMLIHSHCRLSDTLSAEGLLLERIFLNKLPSSLNLDVLNQLWLKCMFRVLCFGNSSSVKK